MKAPSRHAHAALALLFGFALWTGVQGIDFGSHWDEHRIVRSVAVSSQGGLLLPRWYNYPSVLYDVALLSFTPELVAFADRVGQEENPLPAQARSHGFLLRARTVMLVLTLCGALWLYALVLRWQGDPWTALLAAALLLSSFELAYHARWLASDALMMQFFALTALALVSALGDGRHAYRWLLVAAAGAGLACSTKYPGGILLPAVLGAAALWQRGGRLRRFAADPRGWRRRIVREQLGLLLAFVAALVVTTPGAVLEPFRLASDVVYEMTHYQTGHYGYTVEPGLQHAGRLGTYLALTALSPHGPLAAVFFGCALVGVAVGWRRSPAVTAVLAGIPLAYFLYLCTLRVMIVRNVLAVFPFLAAFAAVGVAALVRLPSQPGARRGLAAGVALGILGGLVTLEQAATSIQGRRFVDHGGELVAFLEARPATRVRLSPRARALLQSDGRSPANVAGDREPADLFVLWSEESERLPANRFGLYQQVSGPREINFDYYPSWAGDPRLVALPLDDARSLRLTR